MFQTQKRTAALLLSLALLWTATGCGSSTQTDPGEPEPADEVLYDCGGLQAAIPAEYAELLVVRLSGETERPWGTPLLDVYEKASQDAFAAEYGRSEGVGFLFGIARLDQAAYEQHLVNDYGGVTPFARDEAGDYYAMTTATDVQFYRTDGKIDTQSEDWKTWETLQALGQSVCTDFLSRNGLTAYDDSAFYDRPFTYDGAHAYVEYFTYHTFDGDDRIWDTLVLSQPSVQGEGGVWCVERYYDIYGTVYSCFPDTGTAAAEYYASLQSQCDAGERSDLLTPLGAAEDFARSSDDVTPDCFREVHAPNTGYFELNYAMRGYLHSHTGAGLEFSDPDDPLLFLFLERLSSFTPDTWGVLGRREYGSDWWTPLRAAVEGSAVGSKQETRSIAVMRLYVTAPGEPYLSDLAALLKLQYASDASAFEAALERFHSDQRSALRAASEAR